MAQTQSPASLYQESGVIDHTPNSAVYTGDVVVVNSIPLVASRDIPANTLGALDTESIYKVPKDASVFSKGDPVYWNATGSPVVGTVSTGAASSSTAGANFMGVAAADALTGDATVTTELTAWEKVPTTTPAAASVAAAGANQGNATALPASGFVLVTGADATKGAVILAGTREIKVKNDDAANAVLKVYPPGTLAINALATSAPILMAAKTSATFVLQGSIYYTIPLLPS